ncbi:N-acetylmuramoyl-L-alanine amidase family protein [Piscibacillus salipiscarius]|nr:N-acetylmuramoyl-L-alanine amidase [Piscibacillus salipiscarius]
MTKPGESKDNSLEGRKIVLDLGHGGKDAGAVGVGGVLEKNLLLDTGLVVADKLKDAGAKVILTREKDHYLTLEERVEISKKHNPDAFVSLHYDSFYDSTVSGTTVFYHRDGELAESMKLALDDDPSIKSRGAKKALYKVLTNTKSPSVLLELGFITNPSELEIIQSESYHKEVAEAIKNGLLKYFD